MGGITFDPNKIPGGSGFSGQVNNFPNGVLDLLPERSQAAANAPPPIPGGGSFEDLGGYSQQALQMAGVGAQPQMPSPSPPMPGGGMQPPPPMPGGGMQPPPPMPGGMPGGKNSPFGGQIMPEQLMGLLSNARK